MTQSKRQSLEKPSNIKVQFNQTMDGPFTAGAWDETTADESMKQKVHSAGQEQGINSMLASRKKKSRKVKRRTRMSIEIQRLKDQLYDDKNFIFNS